MALGLAPTTRRPLSPILFRDSIAHAAGLLTGAALVGAALAAIGGVVAATLGGKVLLLVAAAVALAQAGTDLGLWRLPAVGRSWQVPRSWLGTFPMHVAYLLFGLVLGTGFLTAVPYASFTAVLMYEVASANLAGGAAIGLAYGLGRVAAVAAGQARLAYAVQPTAVVPRIVARAGSWKKALGITGVGVAAWIILGVSGL